ncbi:MAG: hypothetical protein ACI4PF_04015 [Christensenellales bacterium]
MKKLFNLILILLIICISSTAFFACNKNDDREYKAEISSSDIAKFTLFTFNGEGEEKLGLMNLGHSFLSIENISENPINILNKTIAPNETISLGTWSILQHFGVWYNVESNYIAQHDKYNGRLSITIGISEEDINTLCDYISSHDRWNPIFNCSNFALNLWNTVASDTEYINPPLIYTPSYIAKQMQKFDNFERNKAIPTDTKMGYFDGSQYVSFIIEGGNYEGV